MADSDRQPNSPGDSGAFSQTQRDLPSSSSSGMSPVEPEKTVLSDSQRVLIRPPTPQKEVAQTTSEPLAQIVDDPLISLLVISPDPELRKDLMVCFERLFEARTAWLDAETLSRGYDLALKRKPALALFDLRNDTVETLRIVARIHEQDPSARMVGVFNPQVLPEGMDKSDLFLEGMRRGLLDFLRLPLAPEEVRRVFERVITTERPGMGGGIDQAQGRMISFFSGKGGVGKTTMVTNSALVLARQFPGQVAIVDSSMDLGNVADYLGVKPNQSLFDAAALRDKLDRDLLTSIMAYHESSGIYLLCGPQKLEHMSGITEQDVTQVLLAVRSVFRFVIIDTLPLFNAISIAVGDLSDVIVVLTEALVPAVNGTRELLSRLREVGFSNERIRILINKYGPAYNADISLELVTESLQRPIDWVLTYDKRMHVSANLGIPYLVSAPNSQLAQQLEKVAMEVAGLPVAERTGLMSKLLRAFG